MLPPRFRAERHLGSGGQADVWLAYDSELDEPVAVKVFRANLDEVSRERLRREVRLGRALSHPRLVRLYELLEAGERLAVAMEWVPGGSLAERLKGGPLALDEVVRIGGQALDALAYLHGRGVVHRDVKPSNMLLDAEGGVRLADFGLARPVGEAHDLTATFDSVGTPGYMSPEQIRGEAPGPAGDLYGLGVTLFELLTGRRPFEASSAFEVARLHATAQPPDPVSLRRECPPWLGRFVLRLLEKKAGDRFASAEEAARALAGRRAPMSRRARLRTARLAGALAIVGLVSLVLQAPLKHALRPSTPFRSMAFGNEVRGVGPKGEMLWRYRTTAPPRQVVQADLDGNGEKETIISSAPLQGAPNEDREPARILILDSRGRELRSFEAESLVPIWPFDFPKRLQCSVTPLDLDGDGADELVVQAHQRDFFPAVLLAYWPKLSLWEPLLYHSGWLDEVRQVPGGPPGRVAFAGRNNRLGHLAVAGELEIRPPSAGSSRFHVSDAGAPPDGRASQGIRLSRYVFLGPHPSAVTSFAVRADRSLTLAATKSRVDFDALGNPVPGPNAGRDLSRERLAFLAAAFVPASSPVSLTPAAVALRIGMMRREAGAVLEEAPYRAVAALVEAENLALAGDDPGAREALRKARADTPIQDVTYRLAHLEAIAGRPREAHRLLESLVDSWTEGPAMYDGPVLDLRTLVESRDATTYEGVVRRILGSTQVGTEGPKGESLFVRQRLWWDRPLKGDAATASWSFLPEGEALAALVRWRLGQTRPGDPDALAAAKERWPDARDDFRVAHSAALLGLGRADEAARELAQEIVVLTDAARWDFLTRQTLDLALALHAKALAASGDRDGARAEAARLRKSLRPGLLPRVLADEVARETGR